MSFGGGVLDQVAGRSQRRKAARWAAASFLLALAASLVVLLAPLGVRGEECTASPSGSSGQTGACEPIVTHHSLVAEEGWRVVVPSGVPVVLAGVGLWAALRSFRPLLAAIAVLLGAFVFLSALSVGIYFLPAEAAMIVATVEEGR